MSRAFFVDERADVESTRLREWGGSVRSDERSLTTRSTWTVSSAGRAPGLHPGGRWFEPNTVHQHGGCTGQARRDCLENRSGRKAGDSSPPPSSSSELSVFSSFHKRGCRLVARQWSPNPPTGVRFLAPSPTLQTTTKQHGGCSSVVERESVILQAWVRFPVLTPWSGS